MQPCTGTPTDVLRAPAQRLLAALPHVNQPGARVLRRNWNRDEAGAINIFRAGVHTASGLPDRPRHLRRDGT